MKKLSIYVLLCIAISGTIYSCAKKESQDDPSNKNYEKLLYEKPKASKTVNSQETTNVINLEGRVTKTVQIRYENDILNKLRNDKEWNSFINNNGYQIDSVNIKKTTIENTRIILLSIPFTSKGKSGFLNVYNLNDKYFWTKVFTENLSGGAKKYSFVTADDKSLMQLNLSEDMRISNFSAAFTSNLLIQNPYFKSEVGYLAAPSCFKDKSYYECLTCIIIQHCGSDLACTIACGAFPEVCLGVAVLACLP
ncbi:hypothetical protein [Pedobacter boryungensis]|uniref:Lipoprotein n=1 Tax=Pedobacter boryungensis TaxID=869962 RepID=A0ABX2DB77_9SPHI|nr:hypothetical protein [Pedobacter boryungensis]NQX31321.1 hypothetical protein [Pedobacter boryungensis]